MTITEQDIMLLRSLKKSAVILLLLMKSGKPLTAKQAARILSINRDTASDYMKSLQAIGLVQHLGKFKGYCMTQKSVQMVLPVDDKSRDSLLLPTTTDINIIDINDNVKSEAVIQKRKNPAFQENKDLIKSCGVGNPSLSTLADLDHVNPEYLKAHIEKWRKEKKGAGLLITRIKGEDPAPKIEPDHNSEAHRAGYSVGIPDYGED